MKVFNLIFEDQYGKTPVTTSGETLEAAIAELKEKGWQTELIIATEEITETVKEAAEVLVALCPKDPTFGDMNRSQLVAEALNFAKYGTNDLDAVIAMDAILNELSFKMRVSEYRVFKENIFAKMDAATVRTYKNVNFVRCYETTNVVYCQTTGEVDKEVWVECQAEEIAAHRCSQLSLGYTIDNKDVRYFGYL